MSLSPDPNIPTKPNHTSSVEWRYGDVSDNNFSLHGRSLLLVILIFSLIFLFTLTVLCVRWARLRRHAVVTVSSHVAGEKRGVDRKVSDKFQVRVHVGDDVACSICLGGLVGEKVKVMPKCDHGFHPECVDLWLGSNDTCPLCRSSVTELPV